MQDNYDIHYILIRADRKGELERTRVLISSYGVSYSKGWPQGYVLLCDALFNKKLKISKLLLNYGCEVNSKNIMPSDPLLYLVFASSGTEFVEMILDNGARMIA